MPACYYRRIPGDSQISTEYCCHVLYFVLLLRQIHLHFLLAMEREVKQEDLISSENRQQTEQLDTEHPVEIRTTASPGGLPQGTDEASRLRELQADVRDQDDLERDITRQV